MIGGQHREVKILVAFRGWIGVSGAGCPGCSVTSDLRQLWKADAVVFHIPATPVPVPIRKLRGQTWVAWSAESETNYPQLADHDFMKQFDLTVTYRRDADIALGYCRPEEWLPFSPPPLPVATDREPAPAVYIASSGLSRSGRTDYVRELMRHMRVDSYGRSLKNRSLPHDDGRPTKLQTISRYRFTLAFENSIAPDYVTEKFFDPLLVGSVPVYLGAPNIADYAPGANCYIDVREFASPRELAGHLLDLAADEQRYARHLSWRTSALDPRFISMVEEQRIPAMCRLCRLLQERRQTEPSAHLARG
jgi:hypothetical protein